MELTEYQGIHRELMQAICESIAEDDKPLVLKDGTALLLCYHLQRFSEDLDFDLTTELRGHINMESICRAGMAKLAKQGIKISLAQFKEPKKTDTTHRCRAIFSLGEGSPPLPLKIEISSRSIPDPSTLRQINGINVYSVAELARLKLLAAREVEGRPYRTAARDLHDLAFIANQWEAELPDSVIADLEDFFSEPEYLMERYSDAYGEDNLLQGQLFTDLGIIEQWNESHKVDDTRSLF